MAHSLIDVKEVDTDERWQSPFGAEEESASILCQGNCCCSGNNCYLPTQNAYLLSLWSWKWVIQVKFSWNDCSCLGEAVFIIGWPSCKALLFLESGEQWLETSKHYCRQSETGCCKCPCKYWKYLSYSYLGVFNLEVEGLPSTLDKKLLKWLSYLRIQLRKIPKD